MQEQLTCSQVSALLTYYVENKLSEKMTKFIAYHLSVCPKCKERYEKLIKITENFKEISKKINDNNTDETQFLTKQYDDFKLNLSAYIDNELTDEENIRMKKLAISNPIARRDLEDVYTFKRLLHSSFDKTKSEIRNDYSKLVLNNLTTKNKYKIEPFYSVMTIFGMIISLIVIGAIYILAF